MQVFKDNDLILIDQLARDFMMKILPLIGNLAMTLRYSLRRLLAPMTPLFLPRKGLLCLCELFLCLAEGSRVVDELAIGECGKVRDS